MLLPKISVPLDTAWPPIRGDICQPLQQWKWQLLQTRGQSTGYLENIEGDSPKLTDRAIVQFPVRDIHPGKCNGNGNEYKFIIMFSFSILTRLLSKTWGSYILVVLIDKPNLCGRLWKGVRQRKWSTYNTGQRKWEIETLFLQERWLNIPQQVRWEPSPINKWEIQRPLRAEIEWNILPK